MRRENAHVSRHNDLETMAYAFGASWVSLPRTQATSGWATRHRWAMTRIHHTYETHSTYRMYI